MNAHRAKNPHRVNFRYVYRRLRDEWQGRGTAAGSFDSLAAMNERLFNAAVNARVRERPMVSWRSAPGNVRINLEAVRCRRLTRWAESEWQRKVALH